MSIFPENISTYGEAIDSLALVITVAVSVGFFIAMGLLCYSMVKFRRRQGTKAAYLTGTTWHQLRWVLIPTLIILGVDLFIDWRTHDVWNLIKQYVPPNGCSHRVTGPTICLGIYISRCSGKLVESPDAFKSMNALHVPCRVRTWFSI